jgi:DinB family protein
MDAHQELRRHLVDLLKQSGAHIDFAAAVADLPAKLRGKKPPGVPHSPWRLIEHMRIAQWDIVEFCRNPRHVSPKFPVGYWPDSDAPPSPEAWNATIAAFESDLHSMCDLVADPATDLFTAIAHGEGQTILREALLVADHNAYHVGQLIVVRRALGAWPDDK